MTCDNQHVQTCSIRLMAVECPMEGGVAILVNGVDVSPKVKEAADGGQGSFFLLIEGLDGQMNWSEPLPVCQILARTSNEQQGYRLALQSAQR